MFAFKIKCIANEKKNNHHPSVDEVFIPFETISNFAKKKQLAYEVTLKPPNDVNYLEPKKR